MVVPLVGGGAHVIEVRPLPAVPGQAHRHPRQPRQGQDGHTVRLLPFGQGCGEVIPGEDGHNRHPDFLRPLGGLRPRRAGGELQLVDELAELQLQQLLVQDRPVEGPAGRVLRAEAHGRIGADHRQAVAQPGVRLPLGKLFDDAGLGLDIGELFIDGGHRPVLPDEGQGCLFPHPLHAGIVVGGIPHQRLQVDHVDGVEAVFGPELLRGDVPSGGLSHPGRHQLDGGAPVDELEGVLIAGDDHRIAPLLPVHPRHGAQKVVRLPALQLVPPDVHGVQHLLQHRHLDGQLLRHPLALGLVPGKGFVPEGGGAHVEGHRQPLGLFLVQQLEQDIEEAEDGVGGQALPGGQVLAHTVKGPVDDGIAVDNH